MAKNFSKNKIYINIIMPRPPKSANNFQKKVKQIVQDELADELEEKHALIDYDNVSLNRAIPSGVVLNGQGNFFKLLPTIEQSITGEAGRSYNTRIGNEITLKSIDIMGMLSYANSNTAQTDYQNGKIAVRVMILKAKEINDVEVLFDNMPTDTLIRFGNVAGTANGPAAFTGFGVDAFRSINRDTFAVRYDKVIYLDAPVILPGSTQPDISVIPSRAKMFKHKLSFGKGLKLKYSTSTDLNANNFPYFMVMGYAGQTGVATKPDDNLAICNMSCVGTYTDA